MRTRRLFAAPLAATALLLAGCSYLSPTQTADPYIPADGVPVTVGQLELRNVLVVADDKGGTGSLIGQAVNPTNSDITLTVSAEGGSAPVKVTVPKYSGAALAADGGTPSIGKLSVKAGSMLDLQLADSRTTAVVSVPVLAADRYYAGTTAK